MIDVTPDRYIVAAFDQIHPPKEAEEILRKDPDLARRHKSHFESCEPCRNRADEIIRREVMVGRLTENDLWWIR